MGMYVKERNIMLERSDILLGVTFKYGRRISDGSHRVVQISCQMYKY
jgi:hypothetical protein